MENTSSPPAGGSTAGAPTPDVLKPREDDSDPAGASAPATATKATKPARHRTYRPSHKATFIGLGVVVLILAVNVGILSYVLKTKNKANDLANSGQVTISSSVLNKVGINSSTVGDSGVQLVVDPDAQFKGKLTVASDVSIGGQLKLNSTLTASQANLDQLQAGNTALAQLDVNGNTTLTNLGLRSNLTVTGTTQLTGVVTVGQLLTVDNSENISGNLAVGGTFTASTFSARSLTSTGTLTIGGHVITAGSTPGIGAGGASLGSNGTYSISGDDSAGKIALNIGAGGSSTGNLVNIAFTTQFTSIPRVIITPINTGGEFYVTNVSVGGFSVGDSSTIPSPGGYGIYYIVEQ